MNKEKSRVTINDVANLANVSAQTVSRAFNNTGYIKEETKNKILECAKKLKYVPSKTARNFRKGETKKIAVVFDSLKNLYFSILIDYLEIDLKELGYTLDAYFVEKHTLTREIYENIVSEGDEAIISLLEVDKEIDELIDVYKLPVLIAGRTSDSDVINFISADDFKGGMIAANELIKEKCQNFLYLGEVPGIICSILRFNGFKDVLNKYGVTPIEIYCYQNVEKELDKLSKENYKFDGIFCFNDMIAYKVKKYFKNKNDIYIIGYDGLAKDIDILEPLKSITIKKDEFAKRIISKIIDLVSKKEEKVLHELIIPELVN